MGRSNTDLYKVSRGVRGKNFVQGLPGGVITEENTDYFDDIPPPETDGHKISPYEPGDYGSDTLSLDKESKYNHGRNVCRTREKDKGREKTSKWGPYRRPYLEENLGQP